MVTSPIPSPNHDDDDDDDDDVADVGGGGGGDGALAVAVTVTITGGVEVGVEEGGEDVVMDTKDAVEFEEEGVSILDCSLITVVVLEGLLLLLLL